MQIHPHKLMQKHEEIQPVGRSWSLLVISIISLIIIFLLIFFVDPLQPLSISILVIPPIVILYLLIFISLFGIISFLWKSKLHGILVASLMVLYLIFRQNNLTHPFFAVMLLALFLVIELMFTYKK